MTTTIEPAAPRLSRSDIRTLSLAALGGALEFYDFIIFVFFTAVIGQLFFPPDTPDWLRQLQAFGLFAAGYLARPLGGIIMAHFGDRAGRKGRGDGAGAGQEDAAAHHRTRDKLSAPHPQSR